MQLLDSTFLPAVLWVLESVDLNKVQRRHLGAMHRTMLERTIALPRRSAESVEEHCRRRARTVTTVIKRDARGQWADLQRYRFFRLTGHIARLSPSAHLVGEVRHGGVPISAPCRHHRADSWGDAHNKVCRAGMSAACWKHTVFSLVAGLLGPSE